MSALPSATNPEPDELDLPTLALRPEELLEGPGLAAPPESRAPERLEPTAAAHAQTPTNAVASEDDAGVMQQYIERLLQRVTRVTGDRGVPAERSAARLSDDSSPRSVRAATTQSEQNLVQSTPVPADVVPASPLGPIQKGADGSAATLMPPVAQMPTTPTTAKAVFKPPTAAKLSQGTAELAAELLAMREPAHRATNCAIDRSVYRQCVIMAWSEVAVATVCLVSGLLVCLLSEKLLSADTIGGVIGLSFGIILLPRGLRSCVRLKRIKSTIERKPTT